MLPKLRAADLKLTVAVGTGESYLSVVVAVRSLEELHIPSLVARMVLYKRTAGVSILAVAGTVDAAVPAAVAAAVEHVEVDRDTKVEDTEAIAADLYIHSVGRLLEDIVLVAAEIRHSNVEAVGRDTEGKTVADESPVEAPVGAAIHSRLVVFAVDPTVALLSSLDSLLRARGKKAAYFEQDTDSLKPRQHLTLTAASTGLWAEQIVVVLDLDLGAFHPPTFLLHHR